MKNRFAFLLILIVIFFSGIASGSSVEYLVFTQKTGDQTIVYTYQPAVSELKEVVRGQNLSVFLQGKYFLYLKDQKLYQYYAAAAHSKELATFKEKRVYLEVIQDGPEQALVVAEDKYKIFNWYVLELSDGSLRRVKQPPLSQRGPYRVPSLTSPDRKATVVIKTPAFSQSPTLLIEATVNGKKETVWSSPKGMMIIPDWPVWSPDSRRIAFYAKEDKGFEGFYSLYLFDLDQKELVLIEKQVLAKYLFSNLSMESFIPAWSKDGKHLIFQSQPNGLPTRSLIMKYDVSTGGKKVLTDSPGSNDYPAWSFSERYISFLSNRETPGRQLYLMDPKGESLRRVSPEEGSTQWASWHRPN
jgi:hypothetical protein